MIKQLWTAIFWCVTTQSLVESYQHFGGTQYNHFSINMGAADSSKVVIPVYNKHHSVTSTNTVISMFTTEIHTGVLISS